MGFIAMCLARAAHLLHVLLPAPEILGRAFAKSAMTMVNGSQGGAGAKVRRRAWPSIMSRMSLLR